MADSGSPTHPEVEPSLLLSLEEHAVALARQAGALLLDLFHQTLQIEYKSKGDRDPVTDADRKAEELLITGIRGRFPNHGILSEEMPEPQGMDRDILWVLDPLDGTTNFMNGYPFFSVSIGVLYRGAPVAGALFVPSPAAAGGQVLHARLGGGAFADEIPIQVYGEKEPSHTGLLTMPAGFWRQFRVGSDLRRRMGDVRTTGSIAYELALVASGALQYGAFSGPKIWDVAAGVLIIREAGGEVLVRTGRRVWKPLGSFLEPNGGIRDDDLRKWGAGILVGNASVISLVARNLVPRSRLWRWLRRLRGR